MRGELLSVTAQLRIPAVYMRGGTSKGVFFHARDLPADPAARDRVLLRVIGSPDRYGRHIDGMGGATSSTSKVVVIAPSSRPGFDVDYLFGAVAVDRPLIDWSGNCGNLSAAVGPFAIAEGLVAAPRDGMATVRIWQANVRRPIIAHVPMRDGQVVECGDFRLDGVAFPSAEIRLAFVEPATGGDGTDASLFPTGTVRERLDVPGAEAIDATLVNAGNPTVFVTAAQLGLRGTESQPDVNGEAALLARVERIRAFAAMRMGIARTVDEASARFPASPRLAYVAPPEDYVASDGRSVRAEDVDLVARIFSMGALHHAMTGTGAVALAVAAAVPGTVVAEASRAAQPGTLRFGHPSGVMSVAADVATAGGAWHVHAVTLSRSARRLMEGWVRIPVDDEGPA